MESALNEYIAAINGVKHWVDLHLHGFTHSFPPECLLSKPEQEELIEQGARLLSMLCHKDFGFKAPGYHSNNDTIEILQRYKIRFLCNEKEVFWYRPIKIELFKDPFTLLQTHTNGVSTDSVEKVYDELNELFKNKDFIFLNDLTE